MKRAEIFHRARTGLLWLLVLLADARLWLLVSVGTGYACIVIGVRLLAGDGWALVAAGICALSFALILGRGIQRG